MTEQGQQYQQNWLIKKINQHIEGDEIERLKEKLKKMKTKYDKAQKSCKTQQHSPVRPSASSTQVSHKRTNSNDPNLYSKVVLTQQDNAYLGSNKENVMDQKNNLNFQKTNAKRNENPQRKRSVNDIVCANREKSSKTFSEICTKTENSGVRANSIQQQQQKAVRLDQQNSNHPQYNNLKKFSREISNRIFMELRKQTQERVDEILESQIKRQDTYANASEDISDRKSEEQDSLSQQQLLCQQQLQLLKHQKEQSVNDTVNSSMLGKQQQQNAGQWCPKSVEKPLNKSQLEENKRIFLNKHNINDTKKQSSSYYSKSVEKGNGIQGCSSAISSSVNTTAKRVYCTREAMTTDLSQNKTKNSLEMSLAGEVEAEFSYNNMTNVTNQNILEELEGAAEEMKGPVEQFKKVLECYEKCLKEKEIEFSAKQKQLSEVVNAQSTELQQRNKELMEITAKNEELEQRLKQARSNPILTTNNFMGGLAGVQEKQELQLLSQQTDEKKDSQKQQQFDQQSLNNMNNQNKLLSVNDEDSQQWLLLEIQQLKSDVSERDGKIELLKQSNAESKAINQKLRSSLEKMEKTREQEHASIRSDVSKLELLLSEYKRKSDEYKTKWEQSQRELELERKQRIKISQQYQLCYNIDNNYYPQQQQQMLMQQQQLQQQQIIRDDNNDEASNIVRSQQQQQQYNSSSSARKNEASSLSSAEQQQQDLILQQQQSDNQQRDDGSFSQCMREQYENEIMNLNSIVVQMKCEEKAHFDTRNLLEQQLFESEIEQQKLREQTEKLRKQVQDVQEDCCALKGLLDEKQALVRQLQQRIKEVEDKRWTMQELMLKEGEGNSEEDGLAALVKRISEERRKVQDFEESIEKKDMSIALMRREINELRRAQEEIESTWKKDFEEQMSSAQQQQIEQIQQVFKRDYLALEELFSEKLKQSQISYEQNINQLQESNQLQRDQITDLQAQLQQNLQQRNGINTPSSKNDQQGGEEEHEFKNQLLFKRLSAAIINCSQAGLGSKQEGQK